MGITATPNSAEDSPPHSVESDMIDVATKRIKHDLEQFDECQTAVEMLLEETCWVGGKHEHASAAGNFEKASDCCSPKRHFA